MNDDNATIEELEDLFGMPEPDLDRIMCDMDGCLANATFIGLDIDGESRVALCKADSYNNRWWGVWPIENDEEFGVPIGASGRDIHAQESDRASGMISEAEYKTNVGYAIAHVSNMNRWRTGTPGITLDKSGDDVGGFIESGTPTYVGLFSHE